MQLHPSYSAPSTPKKKSTHKIQLKQRKVVVRPGNDKNNEDAEAWLKAVDLLSDEGQQLARGRDDMNTSFVVFHNLTAHPRVAAAGFNTAGGYFVCETSATVKYLVHDDMRLGRVLALLQARAEAKDMLYLYYYQGVEPEPNAEGFSTI